MDTNTILAALDAEIARLEHAKRLLMSTTLTGKRPTNAKKRTVSEEGRVRMATAQKARWAKLKKPIA